MIDKQDMGENLRNLIISCLSTFLFTAVFYTILRNHFYIELFGIGLGIILLAYIIFVTKESDIIDEKGDYVHKKNRRGKNGKIL